MIRRPVFAAIIVLSVSLAVSCGGGGTETTQSPVVSPPPPVIPLVIADRFPDPKVGIAYDQPLPTANGVAPLSWRVITNLPPGMGLTFNTSTGRLSGVPTQEGDFLINLEATDSSTPAKRATRDVLVRVVPPLRFTTNSQIFFRRDSFSAFQILTVGGASPVTIQMIGGTVPPGLHVNGGNTISGTPTTVGTYTLTFRAEDSYVGGPETITRDFQIVVEEKSPVIISKEMPKGIVGRSYDFRFSVDGGLPPFTWGAPSPIPGLTFNTTTGSLTGVPTTAGVYPVFVSVLSPGTPFTGFASLSLTIDPAQRGRNDSIATATLIHSGSFPASISPYVNAAGNEAPDTDFYVATANGDAQVTVQINQALDSISPEGFLDPVLEIVNAAGQRLTTCRNPGTSDGLGLTDVPDPTPDAFDDPCINDDVELGVNVNSQLELKIPPGAPVTFYIHVLDFRGDARPEMRYIINVSGVN